MLQTRTAGDMCSRDREHDRAQRKSRLVRDPNLLAIWNAALEDLRRAHNWIPDYAYEPGGVQAFVKSLR
jgi:hypothetical protein